jgi:hypothetical protein
MIAFPSTISVHAHSYCLYSCVVVHLLSMHQSLFSAPASTSRYVPSSMPLFCSRNHANILPSSPPPACMLSSLYTQSEALTLQVCVVSPLFYSHTNNSPLSTSSSIYVVPPSDCTPNGTLATRHPSPLHLLGALSLPLFCSQPNTSPTLPTSGVYVIPVVYRCDRTLATHPPSTPPDSTLCLPFFCSGDYHLTRRASASPLEDAFFQPLLSLLTLIPSMVFTCTHYQKVSYRCPSRLHNKTSHTPSQRELQYTIFKCSYKVRQRTLYLQSAPKTSLRDNTVTIFLACFPLSRSFSTAAL